MKKTSTQLTNSDVSFTAAPVKLAAEKRPQSFKKAGARTILFAVALLCSFFAKSQGTQTVLAPATGSNTGVIVCGQTTVWQDHGGNGNYAVYDDGYTVFYPSAWGGSITVSGSYTTESGYDYVRIYDGIGTGGTQIGSYSGTGVFTFTAAANQTITLRFLSDVSAVYAGANVNVSYIGTCQGPACSGSPLTTTAVAFSSAPLCPGTAMSFSLANDLEAFPNGVSGLTYQWQSSTQSAVGQWNTIPNATVTAYTSPTLNTNTWYSVVVTCTNGNGATTGISAGVVIAGTTTNTIPYYEGFEGVSLPNQLPNCSWLNSNPSNIGTYLQTTTQNRSANTGIKFAAINAAATATNYLYTNGLQLNAGVTYSAALYYKTEYSSLTNFTDLSMLIGMTQSTVGLASIVSSNGPAFSNTYRLLSGTFVVPSSGIYYLAMKATNTAASYYMSIDDISVTAPCALNAPTLAVSGSTAACSGQVVTINAAGANTYTWSVNNLHTSAITVTPAVLANTVINYSVTGTNTLSGCTSTIIKPITINVGPAVSVFPLNTSVCEGGSATLYASSTNQAATFVWNTTGAPGYSTSVTPAASTVYSVNATTNANNCITTSTISIDVVANPTVFASSSKSGVMCQGEALTLTASGATTYSWIANNTGALYIGSSVNPTPNSTTTYMVMGTDAGTGCTGSASITQNVSACVGINNISASNSGINVYPNPNNGMFTVELNDNTVKTISVTDVTGRVLLTNTSSDSTVDFNINAFAAGIYYVKVQSNDKAQVLKVVKQ